MFKKLINVTTLTLIFTGTLYSADTTAKSEIDRPDLDRYVKIYAVNFAAQYPRMHPMAQWENAAKEAYADYVTQTNNPLTLDSFGELFTEQCEKRVQWEQSDYFNTMILSQHKAVATKLIEDGFHRVQCTTIDNVTIDGLLLERPFSRATIIVNAGFFPGRREGMATLYKLLPQYCNILFIDARGHGKSTGPNIWRTITQYGLNEYLDVLSAIEFINQRNNLPIILYGTCAGAYHAARATQALATHGQLHERNVRGLIFDSGWDLPAQAGLSFIKNVPFGSLLQVPMRILYYAYKKAK